MAAWTVAGLRVSPSTALSSLPIMVPDKQHVQPAFDARRGAYRTTHNDDERPWPAGTTTVLAITALTGVDPTDRLPLAGAVDPDTLNTHVRRTAGDAEVSFEFHGHDVTVRDDGYIELRSVDGQENRPHDRPHVDDQSTSSTNSCD